MIAITELNLRDLLGTYSPTKNVTAYSESPEGLIILLSNIFRIAVVAGGIFALINLITSGIQYIGSSGNPELIKQASSRIWVSLLGLVIIASAFVLAGLIGLLFFGDFTAIINPQIYGPGG